MVGTPQRAENQVELCGELRGSLYEENVNLAVRQIWP